ncbi:MAG: branched-chain amino acid ABC transporter permease, partial [Acidimicrobiales bacterium]
MDYLLYILSFFAIYGLLALGLNLQVGHTGILSLAHAAFFAAGAYWVGLG